MFRKVLPWFGLGLGYYFWPKDGGDGPHERIIPVLPKPTLPVKVATPMPTPAPTPALDAGVADAATAP